jgi:transposase-like protein
MTDQSAPAANAPQCPACNGHQLRKTGFRANRQRYRCRNCGRQSYGDGPANPPPTDACPYCSGDCRKYGVLTRNHRRVQRYRCRLCGRTNTNLYPADTPSPGGPFPHLMRFHLSHAAACALDSYCQTHSMSPAQALREILIHAGQKPRAIISCAHRTDSGGLRNPDDWGDANRATHVKTIIIPAPPPVPIPVGGIQFPDLRPEATRKFAVQRDYARYSPTVLVTWRLSVRLSDAALSGLLHTMQRRSLNHQEAARALCIEAK